VTRRTKPNLRTPQPAADPWDGVGHRYPAQSPVSGKVTRVADYGAYVELEPGVEGLIPLSAERLHVGEAVAVVVLDVDE
jgi:small subunit ribosomal protein S1